MHQLTSKQFTCEQVGDVIKFSLGGEIDMATSSVVYDAVRRQMYPRTTFRIDLRRVTFMDSSGLWLMLSLQRECRRLRIDLRFDNLSPAAARVVELAGLTQLLLEPAPSPPPASATPPERAVRTSNGDPQ